MLLEAVNFDLQKKPMLAAGPNNAIGHIATGPALTEQSLCHPSPTLLGTYGCHNCAHLCQLTGENWGLGLGPEAVARKTEQRQSNSAHWGLFF